NLSEKVQLDKEIISKLTQEQLSELEGGAKQGLSCITGDNSCKTKSIEAEEASL
ncbi:class I lanthipeptide, partial [Pedobacter lusitanus]|uniref:class I lanthipeptide n=1 Tax=Pedobacter lusitanus TaxID=1503925 RepID=UPI00190F38D3